MPETSAVQEAPTTGRDRLRSEPWRQTSSVSFHELWSAIRRNRRLFLLIVGALLGVCLLYCLLAPNVYEATARVALRGTPVSVLGLDRIDGALRDPSPQARCSLKRWPTCFAVTSLPGTSSLDLKLYRRRGFMGSFARKFPNFNPTQPSPDARAWLLDEFQRDLTVQTIPRTLVLQIRFRSRDAALSAAVVNALIDAYHRQDTDVRVEATKDASTRLNAQLDELKARLDRDDQKLAEFQKQHGILNTPETLGSGQPTDVEHTAELSEVDALSRELVNATTDRIVLEAEYRAAASGDPELVLASDPRLQASGNFASALLQQLRARRSDLEQEQAQLRIEHGPNFPRVVEIRNQMQDLDRRSKRRTQSWLSGSAAPGRQPQIAKQLVRKSLSDATGAGLKAERSGVEVRGDAAGSQCEPRCLS